MARDHVNSHAVTLHGKLVVRCAAEFMTQRQNLHYKISSQHKLKSDDKHIPKSAQIKLELSVEKLNKKGEAFQALSKKHSQVIAKFQLKLNSFVIEAGDLDLVKKQKLTIISFVESVHNISEVFLTYDDRKDIDAHQCSIDIIELYSDNIAVRLNASKERLLEDYKKKTNSEICLPRASPAPRQQTLRLPLLLINLPPQKPLESGPGAFLTRETPQPLLGHREDVLTCLC